MEDRIVSRLFYNDSDVAKILSGFDQQVLKRNMDDVLYTTVNSTS